MVEVGAEEGGDDGTGDGGESHGVEGVRIVLGGEIGEGNSE